MSKRNVLPTLKQTQFVGKLMMGMDAKHALLECGYSPVSAKNPQRILQSDGVKQEIEEAQKKLRAKIAKDYEWKYNKLKRVINEYIPDEGELVKENVKTAITAIAELNKMTGDYAPDKRLQLTVDHTKGKLHEARKLYKDY